MHHISGTITEEQSSNHSSTHKHTESQLGWRLVTLCVCVCAQMTEQRKRRQRMGFVDVQGGASGAVPPSAAGGNHQIYKT